MAETDLGLTQILHTEERSRHHMDNREILEPFRALFISRDQRDEALVQEPCPIGGCTSVSFDYILSCLAVDPPRILPYGPPGARKKEIYIIPTQSLHTDYPSSQVSTEFYSESPTNQVVFSNNERHGRT